MNVSRLRVAFFLSVILPFVLALRAGYSADPPSTLTASFQGANADAVSTTTLSPDGQADFNIRLGGLRAIPTQIQVTSDSGGVWKFPYNYNWIVGLFNFNSTTGDLYFAQYPSSTFNVQVWYADGTSDQAAVVNPPSPPSTLTASFQGANADAVSTTTLSPDGQADFNIRLGGLRAIPTQIQVTSDSGGVWKFPYNYNWIVGLFNFNSTTGDLYFAQYPSSTFNVQVWYADGTSDQAAVVNPPSPPSTLTASFQGANADAVSTTTLSPDGQADFNIRLGGLRAIPTQIQVTSDSGGVWKFPYNYNWIVGLFNFKSTTGDLYFAQYPSNTFNVQVWYADGTSDQAAVSNSVVDAAYDTVRFLEQSTFGPTSQSISRVQNIGFEAFLNEQVAAPLSDYPDLPFWPQTRPATCTGDCQRDNYTLYQLQRHLYSNALFGPDQLRQRMAVGLSEILVTSAVDVPLPSWMRSYQQLLYRSAFGNFRQLLYDVTLHPTMGRFLDMLNNRCQALTPPNVNICRNGLSSQPNENYAREVLQLFSIGTFLLNQDGTRVLDSNGNPISTYDQKTVEEFARVFTGWVLAPALPAPVESGATTVPNYRDPMVVHKDSQAREDYHDRGPKTLLNGFQLPGA